MDEVDETYFHERTLVALALVAAGAFIGAPAMADPDDGDDNGDDNGDKNGDGDADSSSNNGGTLASTGA